MREQLWNFYLISGLMREILIKNFVKPRNLGRVRVIKINLWVFYRRLCFLSLVHLLLKFLLKKKMRLSFRTEIMKNRFCNRNWLLLAKLQIMELNLKWKAILQFRNCLYFLKNELCNANKFFFKFFVYVLENNNLDLFKLFLLYFQQ